MPFHKTSAAGNIFLHIGEDAAAGRDLGELARRLCDPGEECGGADGVVYYAPNAAGARFVIFNCDGSPAEISGNGMAGLAAVLFSAGFSGTELFLRGSSGERRVRLLQAKGGSFRLRLEMGSPDFENRRFFPFLETEQLAQSRLAYEHGGIHFHPVSVGNPHAVVLLADWPDECWLIEKGAMLESARIFPAHANVEFALPLSSGSCRVFFYERGVGPTGSSGTGSAACFAVLRRLGKAGDRLRVDAPGGRVILSGRDSIFLETEARIVAEGIARLD